MDAIDRRILAELQRDASLPLARLAERVGLSQSPCWRRLRNLEASGVIRGRTVRLDPAALGLCLTVFLEIGALDHTEGWRLRFVAAASAIPDVVEIFRIGGAGDYLLRIVTTDMARFDGICRSLTAAVPVRSLTPRFVMEQILQRGELAGIDARV